MSAPTASPSPRESRWLGLPTGLWLAVAVGCYVLVSFALSWVRLLELATSTWDLGIYQQALWSTAHGRAFYEAPDLESGGFGSLLQVHSVFALYLLVPLYASMPTPLTLFAVQSLVVGAAAVPLYLLTRDLTGSGRWGLVAGASYLVYFPVLSANLFDFHAEAFLPLELFAFVWCWFRGRYVAGSVVALAAFLTMELAPVLVFFAALFFVLPDGPQARRALASLRTALRQRRPLSWLRGAAARFVASRRAMATSAILIGSVIAYLGLLYLREDFLGPWLGVGAFPSAPTGYVIGATPTGLGLSGANFTAFLPQKLLGWALAFALLAFVPFLAPRALVLSVPWAVFSLFTGNPNYVTIGNQYGFIVASGTMVAFAFGLPVLRRALPARPSASSSLGRARGNRRRSYRAAGLLGAVAVVLVLNVVASPINPLLDNIGIGSGYAITLDIPGGFAAAQSVARLVPAGAVVLASADLFPLVANDLNAYSLPVGPDPGLRLPFNATERPTYVFLSSGQAWIAPGWVNTTIEDPRDYGVLGIAEGTPAGTLELYESGYAGSASRFGP